MSVVRRGVPLLGLKACSAKIAKAIRAGQALIEGEVALNLSPSSKIASQKNLAALEEGFKIRHVPVHRNVADF